METITEFKGDYMLLYNEPDRLEKNKIKEKCVRVCV